MGDSPVDTPPYSPFNIPIIRLPTDSSERSPSPSPDRVPDASDSQPPTPTRGFLNPLAAERGPSIKFAPAVRVKEARREAAAAAAATTGHSNAPKFSEPRGRSPVRARRGHSRRLSSPPPELSVRPLSALFRALARCVACGLGRIREGEGVGYGAVAAVAATSHRIVSREEAYPLLA